jgi:hypothetical protein
MKLLMSLLTVITLAGSAYAGRTFETYEYTAEPNQEIFKNPYSLDNVPRTLSSPRTVWGKPSVFSPINALFLVPVYSAREVLELEQRMDIISCIAPAMDFNSLSIIGGENWYSNPFGEKVAIEDYMIDRLHPMRRYDAIVIGKLDWNIIPEKARAQLIQHISNGTALLYINPTNAKSMDKDVTWDNEPRHDLLQNLPVELMTISSKFEALRKADKGLPPRTFGPFKLRTGKLGNGTVAFLSYNDAIPPKSQWSRYTKLNTLTPFLPYNRFDYEYQEALLAKLLLNLTNRVSPLSITAQETKIPISALPGKPLSFSISPKSGSLSEMNVEYEVRDMNGKTISSGSSILVASGNSVSYAPEIPALPRGNYAVDLWLKAGERIIDWASASLRVEGTQYLGLVSFDAPFQTNEKPIVGKVALLADLPSGCSIKAKLFDSFGRLLVEKTSSSTGFDFPTVGTPLADIYDVVLEVVDSNGKCLDKTTAYTYMHGRKFDDVLSTGWAVGDNNVFDSATLYWVKKLGVNALYDPEVIWSTSGCLSRRLEFWTRSNLQKTPYFSAFGNFIIKPDMPLKASMTSHYLSGADTIEKIKLMSQSGTLMYSICEESTISSNEEAWDNPEALKEFVIYLKEKYKSIDDINKQWLSSFKDFPDMKWTSLAAAKANGLLSQWLEQELFKINRFEAVHTEAQNVIRKYDKPDALTSLDCITGLNYDWERVRQNFAGYTASVKDDGYFQRALPGSYTGIWWGTYVNEMNDFTVTRVPWQTLFAGGNEIAWWMFGLSFPIGAAEPMPYVKLAGKQASEILSGTGKFLIKSKKPAEIAIMYSPISEFADIVYQRKSTQDGSRKAITNLLQFAGLAFDWVGADYVSKKLATDKQYKILLIPSVQAMSRESVEAIRKFAENGGIVVADVIPATCNDLLVPADGKFQVAKTDGKKIACSNCGGAGKVDSGLIKGNCKTCGGTGNIIEGGSVELTDSLLNSIFSFKEADFKTAGKGGTWFLNRAFSDYKVNEMGAFRTALVEKAKLTAPFKVTNILGAASTDCKSYPLLNGPAIVCGILPEAVVPPPPGNQLNVVLDKPYHAYNARTKQYLGETAKLPFTLKLNYADIFVFLPAKIEGISAKLNALSFKGGETAKLSVALLPASLKTVTMIARIGVKLNRVELPEFDANISYNGSFELPLPLALNQPGAYEVTITDVVSGISNTLAFMVK